jgi:hypothetical protein
MNPKNLFSELKRRNVLRAGALYAAGAWLLVQNAEVRIAKHVEQFLAVVGCLPLT